MDLKGTFLNWFDKVPKKICVAIKKSIKLRQFSSWTIRGYCEHRASIGSVETASI